LTFAETPEPQQRR